MCVLQLACLEANCAILDEIDSGLDIDALRDVSAAVNGLKKAQPNMSVLMVTHYKVNIKQPVSLVYEVFRCLIKLLKQPSAP